MIKNLPDYWVRLAISNAINNIAVDCNVIPCYDTRVPSNSGVRHYVLMTTQTNTVNKSNKCENSWESSILLDIITTYSGAGSTGRPGG